MKTGKTGTSGVPDSADRKQGRPRGRKLGRWILGAVGAVLLVFLAAGMATEWFGLYGPLTKVGLAVKRTMDAGSLTADFAVALGGTEAEGELRCCWDLEDRELAASLLLQLGEKTYNYGIVDGHVVWRDARGKAKHVDISDELESFFDAMESESDLDRSLRKLLETVFSAAGLLEQINMEEAVACLKSAFLKCNRTGWLEENAGYSVRKRDGVTLYEFEPETGTLLLELLREFAPAFADRVDYQTARDGLKAQRAELNESSVLQMVFGIRSGQLARLEVEADLDGRQFSARIDLKKIGRTKVDTESLRQIKEESLS